MDIKEYFAESKAATLFSEKKPRLELEAYKKYSLADIVLNRLRNDIIHGKYKPEEHLIVRRLSEDLDVSHTPINEALNRLVTEGYVEYIPRRGMQVRNMSVEDFLENLEVRLILEEACAGQIVREAKNNPDFLKELWCFIELFEMSRNTDISDDYNRWVSAEIAFHGYYLDACRNEKLLSVFKGLKVFEHVFYIYYLNKKPLTEERYINVINEHKNIVRAIETFDPDEVKKAIRDHVIEMFKDHKTENNIDKTRFCTIDLDTLDSTLS